MLLNFREKYKIPYTQLLEHNFESVYLTNVTDLNTAVLPNMIMEFFIKKIVVSSCITYH